MQLDRAFFLSTVCTTHHGLCDVCALEHDFLGPGLVLSATLRFEVHRAELPLLERVMHSAGARHPVSQLDQFALQSKQVWEILTAAFALVLPVF